jgi:hypothetical protein
MNNVIKLRLRNVKPSHIFKKVGIFFAPSVTVCAPLLGRPRFSRMNQSRITIRIVDPSVGAFDAYEDILPRIAFSRLGR